MNRAIFTLAAAGCALVLSTIAAPAASAGAATDEAAATPGYTIAACENWTLKIAEGHASGTWCANYTVVSGTVTDDKADGRCPFVRSHWSNGGVSDGPWVGPKGKSKAFTLNAPSGTWSTQLTIHYIFC